MDWNNVEKALKDIYNAVDALEDAFRGVNQKFTPDGHMVGSIGEVLAYYAFDLAPLPNSYKNADARAKDGREVEIKLTQAKRVALRHCPEHLIVLQKPRHESTRLIFNGPGKFAFEAASKKQSNGQYAISIAKLIALNKYVLPQDRLPQKRDFPI